MFLYYKAANPNVTNQSFDVSVDHTRPIRDLKRKPIGVVYTSEEDSSGVRLGNLDDLRTVWVSFGNLQHYGEVVQISAFLTPKGNEKLIQYMFDMYVNSFGVDNKTAKRRSRESKARHYRVAGHKGHFRIAYGNKDGRVWVYGYGNALDDKIKARQEIPNPDEQRRLKAFTARSHWGQWVDETTIELNRYVERKTKKLAEILDEIMVQ